MAKFGCSLDDGCIAVVDKGCDQIGPFQLCEKKRLKDETKSATCNHPFLKNQGRTIPHIAKTDVIISEEIEIWMILHYTTEKLYSSYSIYN